MRCHIGEVGVEEESASYVAHYWRHGAEMTEEAESLDIAVAFLAAGWEAGDLTQDCVVGPDGETVLEGAELFARMATQLGM